MPFLFTPNQSLCKRLGLAFKRLWALLYDKIPLGWGRENQKSLPAWEALDSFQPYPHLQGRLGNSQRGEGGCLGPGSGPSSACLGWVTFPSLGLGVFICITGTKRSLKAFPSYPLRRLSSAPATHHCHRETAEQVSETRRSGRRQLRLSFLICPLGAGQPCATHPVGLSSKETGEGG